MNKLFKKNLLMISITIFIAASAIFICYKKVQHQSQTESQSSSQTNPITSQYVIEKYSETVKNVKSFKYLTEFTVKSTIKNPATGEIDTLDRIMEVTSEEVSFSTEPFARLSNRTSVFSNYTIKKNSIRK